MRTVAHPQEINDTVNLALALEVGDSRELVGQYEAAILLSYANYNEMAPELVRFQGVVMLSAAKAKMLNFFERTNGGSLSSIRESLKRSCLKCPFCNINRGSDLDHFLSKDKFPCFAIFSWNLIPVCPECNRLKLGGSEGAFIHCYHDHLPETPFLVASIGFEPGIVTVIYSLDLSGTPTPLAKRVQQHFEVLDLENRYGLEAQDRLDAWRQSLPGLLAAGGSTAVREELLFKKLEASIYGVNHWEYALLAALIESEIFCNGAFRGL